MAKENIEVKRVLIKEMSCNPSTQEAYKECQRVKIKKRRKEKAMGYNTKLRTCLVKEIQGFNIVISGKKQF